MQTEMYSVDFEMTLHGRITDVILETGGIFIAPRPSAHGDKPKPEFAMRPFFGVEPVLLNSEVSRFLNN